MGEWKKRGVMWKLVFDCTEGGEKLAVNPFVSPLSFLHPPPVQICPCCFLSCIFCPRCRWSPVLLRLLNRWPVGSLTLINLTSIRPEVIGMLQRWLQGSRAAQESSCPLMNGSHRARNVWVSAKSMAFKHGDARKDGGMNRGLKDRRDNSFVMCYVISADLDGFTLSICAQTSSLCPPRCSSFPSPSPVICTWNPSCLTPRVSLPLCYFLPHICPSLVTSSALFT